MVPEQVAKNFELQFLLDPPPCRRNSPDLVHERSPSTLVSVAIQMEAEFRDRNFLEAMETLIGRLMATHSELNQGEIDAATDPVRGYSMPDFCNAWESSSWLN